MLDDMINQIHCGDCLVIMPLIPDGSIDLAVTSPPYDNLREYKGYTFDFPAIAAELYRVTKNGGVVVWVVGDATINGSETGTSFRQALGFMEIGFNLHDTMIYLKDVPPQNGNRYEQQYEYMFVLSKLPPKTFNPLRTQKLWQDNRLRKKYLRNTDGSFTIGSPKKDKTKVIGNVWYYEVGGGKTTVDKIAYNHPAIFPDKLAQDHILSWSNAGDIVLDPMCGSGTTCKAAVKLKRRYIGIDVSEDYCQIAHQRIKQELAQLTFDL